MEECIVAIGDIHGRSDLLSNLWQKIENHGQWQKAVFLGDYIDNGPESREVIDFLLELEKKYGEKIVFLKGNHEQWLLDAYHNYQSTSWLIGMGGLDTIASYVPGLEQQLRDCIKQLGKRMFDKKDKEWQLPYHLFFDAMPKKHLQFIRNLKLYHHTSKVIFVHAGIKPGVALAKQKESDLLWIGENFHKNYDGEEYIIFGHYTTSLLRSDKQPLPFYGENKIIGIDTGSWQTEILTAYFWPSGDVLSS